jgi:hypothetical protein
LNPCGLAVDIGRDYAHVTKIYPFKDRPDIGVDALFWPLPLDADHVPFANPFTLRNWDRLEQLPEPILGTRYDPKVYYTGPLPDAQPGTPTGSIDEWQNGLLYSVYVADGYHTNCLEFDMPIYVTDVFSPLGSITVGPHNGHVLEDLNLNHSNQWLVTQIFDARPNPANDSLICWGHTGVNDVIALEVLGSGKVQMQGPVHIGGFTLTTNANLFVIGNVGQAGFEVRLGHSGPHPENALQIKGPAAAQVFAVNWDGEVLTNQTTGVSGVLGSVVAKMPIFDSSGTLVGYLPLYDSIT